MGRKTGGRKWLGESGKPVTLDGALPASTKTAEPAMQPGGGVFVKPALSHPENPSGSLADKPVRDTGTRPVSGVPVSGRTWKLEAKRKSTMFKANSSLRKPWNQKMAEKAQQKAVQAKQAALIQERIDERRAKKAEIEEREKRKEANKLKGAVVQQISTATVKRLSRKQLRKVKKMDVNSEINPAPIKKTKGNKGKVLV